MFLFSFDNLSERSIFNFGQAVVINKITHAFFVLSLMLFARRPMLIIAIAVVVVVVVVLIVMITVTLSVSILDRYTT